MQNKENTPVSPQEWFDTGVSYRRQGRFGDAMNAFAQAIDSARSAIAILRDAENIPAGAGAAADMLPSGTAPSIAVADREIAVAEYEKIITESEASLGLIREITGFVNKDLMNP